MKTLVASRAHVSCAIRAIKILNNCFSDSWCRHLGNGVDRLRQFIPNAWGFKSLQHPNCFHSSGAETSNKIFGRHQFYYHSKENNLRLSSAPRASLYHQLFFT